MQTSASNNHRQDLRALNAVLLKRRTTGWLWRAVVLLILFLVWLWACQTILHLGSQISYEGLESLGPEVVKILTRINPYVWWGVVAIFSLVVFSFVRSWFILSSRHLKSRLIPVTDIQKLAKSLSPESLKVLQWTWDATLEPITIGDLLITRNEIRAGRIRKLAMVDAQKKAIHDALSGTSITEPELELKTRLSVTSDSEPSIQSSAPVIRADKKVSQKADPNEKIEPVL